MLEKYIGNGCDQRLTALDGLVLGKFEELLGTFDPGYLFPSDHGHDHPIWRGEVSIFEQMLSKKLGIRPELLKRLLFEPGGEGLAIACRAVEIPPKIFAAIYRMTREAKEDSPEKEVGELTRVTSFYLAIDAEMAREVLTKWCRDPEYLWAIKQLSRTAERTMEAEAEKEPA